MKENENKKLTDEEIEEKLKRYTSSSLPNTRKYLVEKLKEDPGFKGPIGLIVKQDLIDQYYITRKENNIKVHNYSFNYVPNIIKSRKEKFTLFIDEISTKTKKIIGEYKTTWERFITYKKDNLSLTSMDNKQNSAQYVSTDLFMKKLHVIHPYYSKTENTQYINVWTDIELLCDKHNITFTSSPHNLYAGKCGCPECAREKMHIRTKDEFQVELDSLYGNNELVCTFYSGEAIPAKVVDPKTNITYTKKPCHFREIDPRIIVASKGEYYIKCWAENNATILSSVETQVWIENLLSPKYEGSDVYIDFKIFYNNINYWIEYNGEQHYNEDIFFHKHKENSFERQVYRDNKIRDYVMSQKDSIFIEIPYTFHTKKKIWDLLDKIIISGDSPSDIIKLPEINYGTKK